MSYLFVLVAGVDAVAGFVVVAAAAAVVQVEVELKLFDWLLLFGHQNQRRNVEIVRNQPSMKLDGVDNDGFGNGVDFDNDDC